MVWVSGFKDVTTVTDALSIPETGFLKKPRSIDIMVTADTEMQPTLDERADGNAFVNWLIDHADDIKIKGIIFSRDSAPRPEFWGYTPGNLAFGGRPGIHLSESCGSRPPLPQGGHHLAGLTRLDHDLPQARSARCRGRRQAPAGQHGLGVPPQRGPVHRSREGRHSGWPLRRRGLHP